MKLDPVYVIRVAQVLSWISFIIMLVNFTLMKDRQQHKRDETIVALQERCCPTGVPFNVDVCRYYAGVQHQDCGGAFDAYVAANSDYGLFLMLTYLWGILGGSLTAVATLALWYRYEYQVSE